MLKIVRVRSPVLAAVTDVTDQIGYVKARKEADKLAAEYSLTVADMPLAIEAMTSHPEVREAIRPVGIDTITGEYHGQRDGKRSYEAWHSVGSLATAKGLEEAFFKTGYYAFMPIYDEWLAVGKSSYNGQTVTRIHLDDVKKGSVPTAGTPYTVFVRLDKDAPKINGSGQLSYDDFMQDDRVLMITGSPESREALAKMLFGRKEEGGEGWDSIGSYHAISEVGFDAKAKGRLVTLSGNLGGLGGNSSLDYILGRFMVCIGGTVRKKSAPQSIVQPTLEQTLIVTNNFD